MEIKRTPPLFEVDIISTYDAFCFMGLRVHISKIFICKENKHCKILWAVQWYKQSIRYYLIIYLWFIENVHKGILFEYNENWPSFTNLLISIYLEFFRLLSHILIWNAFLKLFKQLWVLMKKIDKFFNNNLLYILWDLCQSSFRCNQM